LCLVLIQDVVLKIKGALLTSLSVHLPLNVKSGLNIGSRYDGIGKEEPGSPISLAG
jgi:hypothetical protein